MAPPKFKLISSQIKAIGSIGYLKSITYSCPWRKDNDEMMYEIIKFSQLLSNKLKDCKLSENYELSIMYKYYRKHEGERYISSPFIPVGEDIDIPNAEYGQADITIEGRISHFTIMVKIPVSERIINFEKINT